MPDNTQVECREESHSLATPNPRDRHRLRLLLMAALLHGLTYLVLLPPWMGEDEPWHVEYSHHVAAGHMPWGGVEISRDDLPDYSPSQAFVLRELGGLDAETIASTQQSIVDSMAEHRFWERVDWASWGGGVENFDQVAPYFTATHQPPLYYMVLSPVLAIFGGGDVLQEMWVGRGISLLAYLAVVLAAYEVGRRVCNDPQIALVGALLVAWWPMHARQAAVVNNDVLVKVASAWALVISLDLVRLGLTWKRAALAFGLVAIGLAFKTTGAGVLAPLGLAILWRTTRGGLLQNQRVRLAGLITIVLLVVTVVFVYRFSHNPAIPDTLENLQTRVDAVLSPKFRRTFVRSAVGAFNWYSRRLPDWQYAAVGYALLLSTLGLVVAFVRRSSGLNRRMILLCLAGCACQLLLVILRGTAAGRYVMPMLPAFATLIAAGFLVPLPPQWRTRATALLVIALVALDGYFAWAGLTWNQYGVWSS
jgi:4-amino-4-deoxy-L-arabinose transferase-like glycosyltransferase